MVTHNEAIQNMADHVVLLKDGMITKDTYNNQKIEAERLEW